MEGKAKPKETGTLTKYVEHNVKGTSMSKILLNEGKKIIAHLFEPLLCRSRFYQLNAIPKRYTGGQSKMAERKQNWLTHRNLKEIAKDIATSIRVKVDLG